MKIPERCPDIGTVINSGPLVTSEDVIRFAKEYNGRYLHWNDLKYRKFGESNRVDTGSCMYTIQPGQDPHEHPYGPEDP